MDRGDAAWSGKRTGERRSQRSFGDGQHGVQEIKEGVFGSIGFAPHQHNVIRFS